MYKLIMYNRNHTHSRIHQGLLQKQRSQFAFILLLVLSILFCVNLPTKAQQATPITLTVSAGAGLKSVMEEIKQIYQQKQPLININYNFAASGVLARQIEQGANIDIFISASNKNMNQLQKQDLLLANTRLNLVKSQIVLITPKNHLAISGFQDLPKSTVQKIAIGEPRSVPLGVYAQEVMRYFGILKQVQPKLVYARSGLEILNFVASGNVDVGIVHDTNAKQSQQVKIVAIAPENSHSPVIYPVAVLKNSKNQNAAKLFVQFLFQPQVKQIFNKYGYTMAN